MDGLLLVDKPSGPTSHDVVARVRRAIGERQIGHTGTLDPLATGLLPLVIGRATRLSSRLTGHAKSYDADVTLGAATDTDDTEGRVIGPVSRTLPDAGTVDAALDGFRGTFAQVPPRHSAKKIGGEKAYALARRDVQVTLAPVTVTVHSLERLSIAGDRLSLRLHVSSGFYVRALARDLGARLGCGAHLSGLRRTAVGRFAVKEAVALDEVERAGRDVAASLVPLVDVLAEAPKVVLTAPGLARARHGNPVGPEHLTHPWVGGGAGDVRLVDAEGRLVAVAEARHGALHPVVVLG